MFSGHIEYACSFSVRIITYNYACLYITLLQGVYIKIVGILHNLRNKEYIILKKEKKEVFMVNTSRKI